MNYSMNIQARRKLGSIFFILLKVCGILFIKDSEVIELYFKNKIFDIINMINFSKAERKKGSLIVEWIWNQSIPSLNCINPSLCFNVEEFYLYHMLNYNLGWCNKGLYPEDNVLFLIAISYPNTMLSYY